MDGKHSRDTARLESCETESPILSDGFIHGLWELIDSGLTRPEVESRINNLLDVMYWEHLNGPKRLRTRKRNRTNESRNGPKTGQSLG